MAVLFFSLLCFISSQHDFHVSVCQVEYKQQELQCTLRVFTEDLENELQDALQGKLKLGTAEEIPTADQLISDYLETHFKIGKNGLNLAQTYVGKEVEFELTFLYFSFPCDKAPEELRVFNSMFLDSFEDQSNIVNVKIGEEVKSAFCNNGQLEELLKF
jgi:hypothetical protein